jgi:hypothetical protein
VTREGYKAASDVIWNIDTSIERLTRDLVDAESKEPVENAKRIYAATTLLRAARQMLRDADGILGRSLVTR